MRRNAAGYILLPVAIAIALIAVIAFLSSRQSAMETNLGANEEVASQVEYVSQAGLQHALRNLAQQGCGPYTDLTNVSLGSGSYSSVLTTGLGATTAYTVAVDQDSWIDESRPGDTNGSDTSLSIGFDGTDEARALLRFDLSTVPAGSSVLSAIAWLYIDVQHPQGSIDLHRVSADWDEGIVTWNELGDSFFAEILASIPAQDSASKWIAVNLTAQTQAWVNGEDNYGLALRSMVTGLGASYASQESSEAPYLELLVGTPPVSPVTLDIEATLGNGVNHRIARDQITLRQRPASHAESRLGGASGKDALLDSSFSNRNYGDYELGLSSKTNGLMNSLLYFKIPALSPDAIVESAELMLYHKNTTSSGANPGGQVFRVTRDWLEGSQSGSGGADGATWDTWNGADDWTEAGGDIDAQAVALAPISTAAADWESWEIKSLVQDWISGRYANQGLMLKASGDIHAAFASKEDADPALHPRLAIKFSCQCGQVCVAPQGSGKIMMVVENAINLTTGDAELKLMFESWGYQVAPIRDNESANNYAALAADSDVVFISESVDSPNVGNKLTDLAIGIVSQDGTYNPD
ncbi:MAG: DNRLRE domain-containing protein, partial [Gammaproteobacteria bacterium]